MALPWFRRSQINTSESSPPDASVPLREGDHSMQLIAAACPRSSSNACPGCRTSRIRMLFESCENVARRCASWGEAARHQAKPEERSDIREDGVDLPASLSSGGAYDIVCCAVVGLIFPGLEARSEICQKRCDASDQKRLTFLIVLLRRLVYDCTVF